MLTTAPDRLARSFSTRPVSTSSGLSSGSSRLDASGAPRRNTGLRSRAVSAANLPWCWRFGLTHGLTCAAATLVVTDLSGGILRRGHMVSSSLSVQV